MKRLLFSALITSSLILSACGGSAKDDVLIVPTDMPEICRGIDFVSQPDMREVCGVRPVRFQSYKNIPMQRYMIMPKGALLVKTSGKVELRLPNMLPIPLTGNVAAGIEFSQDKRLEYVKNRMIYNEHFPPGQTRIQMFQLEIPLDNGTTEKLCFNLPETKVDSRKRSHMGEEVESLDCADFDNIVAKYEKR